MNTEQRDISTPESQTEKNAKTLRYFLDILPPLENSLTPAYFIWVHVKFHSWTLHKYNSGRGLNYFETLITKAVSTVHHCFF